MTLLEQFSIGEKAHGGMPPSLSPGRGKALALAGGAGALLSVVLAISLFLNYMTVSMLIALVVYLTTFVAVVVLTSGRERNWATWMSRLLLPLPGALLLWWGLAALGL